MHLNSVELFHLQLPWWEILAIGYHFHFHMSDLRYFLKPYFSVELFTIRKVTQATILTHFQCQQTLHPTSAHSDCEQSLQPIDWQGQPAACLPSGSGPKDVYTSGGFMGHVVHLPPIPQHPRTPGHKAFRSQLTANELGGIRFAGVGPKWSTIQPRSARANLLWQPRALGIWGRYLPTKIPHLSGTPDAHGSDLQLMSPPGTSR